MRLLPIVALFFATTPGAAQTWQSTSFDTGALYHGTVFAPGNSMALTCTAPSPQGLPLIETGDHESLRTDTPYDMAVSFGNLLVDAYATPDHILPSPTVTFDGVTFALPRLEYSDFHGAWTGGAAMTDELFLALTLAGEMIVDPGRGTAYAYPTDGLRDAFLTAVSYCISGWEQAGQVTPGALQFWRDGPQPVAIPAPASAPQTTGYASAPALAVPETAPPAVEAHITDMCQGPYEITDISQVQASDIDGDGVADYLLNWSDVSCRGGMQGRAFCGAANCTIEVFVSSRGYADPVQMLGIGADFVQDAEGRVGLLLAGTPFICSDGFCDTPWYWNGEDLAQ